MSKKIIFTPVVDIAKEYYPSPAESELPEWYKNTPSYPYSKKYTPLVPEADMTIKKCIPVFDAISMGYIIKTHCDIYVDSNNGYPNFYATGYENVIDIHPKIQAERYPKDNSSNFFKFLNPWSVETDSGYSCLIIPPMHRDNKYLTILPGVVDTDTYHGVINLPFVIKDLDYSGNIPAGTPIAQVIPFKRESYKMSIGSNTKKIENFRRVLKVVWKDSYKNRFWNKKTYR
jgi:hypothetical protein